MARGSSSFRLVITVWTDRCLSFSFSRYSRSLIIFARLRYILPANKFLFLDGTRHVSHSRINTSKYISFPVVKFSHFFIFFSSFLSFSANELFPYDLQMIFAEIFRMVLRMETKAFQFDRGDYLPRAPTIMTVF